MRSHNETYFDVCFDSVVQQRESLYFVAFTTLEAFCFAAYILYCNMVDCHFERNLVSNGRQ